jgi:hypothetical protein
VFEGSFFDFLRNGLLEKNPDCFFSTDLVGDVIPGRGIPLMGGPLLGEFLPDIGSALVKELGFEYSLWSSLLPGRPLEEGAVSALDGASVRQSMVMPSRGSGL